MREEFEASGAVCARSLQPCPTLSDPMDCRTPGSSVLGIFQVRILKWVAIFFSRDLPNPEIKPFSPTLQADSLLLTHQGRPLEP